MTKKRKLIEGKEKAWAAGLVGFAITFINHKYGGAPLDPKAVVDFTNILTEIGVGLVGGGVSFFATWLTANTPQPTKNTATPTSE